MQQSKGKGKGQGMHGGKGGRKGSASPCNYFMAGFCRFGENCTAGVHNYQYGQAFAEHWCCPLTPTCDRVNHRLVRSRDYLRIALAQRLPKIDESSAADSSSECRSSPAPEAVALHGADNVAKFCALWRLLQKEVDPIDSTTELLDKRRAAKAAAEAEKELRRYISFKRNLLPEEAGFIGTSTTASGDEAGGLWPWSTGSSTSTSATAEFRTTPEFLLVLDLEGKDEITEFPVLVLQHGQEVGRFHRFVRPVCLFSGDEGFVRQGGFHPDCPSVPFSQVVDEFEAWVRSRFGIDMCREPREDDVFAFVTCGEWDCKSQIPKQAGISGISASKIRGFQRFANIKKVYSQICQRDMEKRGMKGMLNELGWLEHTGVHQGEPLWGSHHSGMHDVENIALCLLRALEGELDGVLPATSLPSWTWRSVSAPKARPAMAATDTAEAFAAEVASTPSLDRDADAT